MKIAILALILICTIYATLTLIIDLMTYIVDINHYVLNIKERNRLYKRVMIRSIIFSVLVTVFYVILHL